MSEKNYQWVSVDEAFVLCQQVGLNRTRKTIRTWARKAHVDAKMQTTPTGDRWMLEAASLDVKIKSELEFLARSATRSNQFGGGANMFEPVQAEAEPVRTRSETFEQVQTSAEVSALEAKVESLQLDKTARDAKIEFLTQQNREWQQALMGQSRYIGHLETKLTALGKAGDQAFLEAPMPERPIEPEIVNPDQPDLGVG